MDPPNKNAAQQSAANKTRESLQVSDNIPSRGWFKAMRSETAIELIRLNPNAFVLAYLIAYRARYRTGFNADNLRPGEAMLGDFKAYRMTERQYRTAKSQLENNGFATFRTTNRGTIGKLIDTRLFDPLNIADDEQKDRQETDSRQAADRQETTNKNDKKDKKGENSPPALSVAEKISFERELERIGTELNEMGKQSDYAPGSKKFIRIGKLNERQKAILETLGMIA